MYFLNAVLFFSQATSYDIRCVYLQQLSLWHQPNWAATQHPPVDGGCSQTFLLPKVLLQKLWILSQFWNPLDTCEYKICISSVLTRKFLLNCFDRKRVYCRSRWAKKGRKPPKLTWNFKATEVVRRISVSRKTSRTWFSDSTFIPSC